MDGVLGMAASPAPGSWAGIGAAIVFLSSVVAVLVMARRVSRERSLRFAMGEEIAARDRREDAGRIALAAAEASAASYRLLADNAHDMIATMLPDSTILFVTPAVQRVLGYTPAEIVGRRTLALTHPDDIPLAIAMFTTLIGAGPGAPSASYEFRALHKDGRWIWLEGQPRVDFDQAGKPRHFQDAVRDISVRKATEAALRRSQSFLARTSHVAGVGGWELDIATGGILWSDETCRLHDLPTGYAPTLEEAIGFYAPDARPIIEQAVREGIESGTPWDIELPITSATGRMFWARAVGAVEFERGRAVRLVGAFQDVSELRRMTRELTYRATHDPLTGLANRAEFEARLSRLVSHLPASPTRHALLLLDLDRFKSVNDTCGHAAGDAVLRRVSALLKESVRHGDTVARLGGDEFGIILEGCDGVQAAVIAQAICDLIDRFRFACEGIDFRIGTSIGLVCVDTRWTDAATLVEAADTACYAAKQGGRNAVHEWSPEDHTGERRKDRTERMVTAALAE